MLAECAAAYSPVQFLASQSAGDCNSAELIAQGLEHLMAQVGEIQYLFDAGVAIVNAQSGCCGRACKLCQCKVLG